MDDIKDDNGDEFSKLEAGFAELEIKRRPISVEVQGVSRHAKESDLIANDLDFDYSVNTDSLPPKLYPSMQGILPALQYSSHLTNANNFADETDIECFDQTDDHVAFLTLDSTSLDKVLNPIKKEDLDLGSCDTASIIAKHTSNAERHSSTTQVPHTSSASTKPPSSIIRPCSSTPETARSTTDPTSATTEVSSTVETSCGRLLVFFVPLIAKKGSSFGSQVSMQRSSVQRLFEILGMNPEFFLNMLGRPDYWSPRTRWQYNIKDELTVCGTAYQSFPIVLILGANQK